MIKIIVVSAGSNSWYKNSIGKEFDVDDSYSSYEYQVKNDDKFILKCHCKIIK